VTIERLINTSISNKISRLDLELMIGHVLNCKREQLYTRWDDILNSSLLKKCQHLITLRKKGMPIAYITGKKEFYDDQFSVNSNVFIPRPETEILVSYIFKQYLPHQTLTIMDFGCGSGCIGLSLLKKLPKALLIGVDCNEQAIYCSKKNAQMLGVNKRTLFIKDEISSLHPKQWHHFTKEKIDIIVANPPYISFNDPRVESHVVLFEPAISLFSPKKGLHHIYSWLQKASELLDHQGHYFFEIGQGQAQKIQQFCQEHVLHMHYHGWMKDFTNHIRMMHFQRIYGHHSC